SVLVSGEPVWPRPAFRNGLPSGMNQLSRFVSLHPYFKVPPDKMPYLKAILPEFVAKTRNETGNLFYEFTINGDEVFCREGYVNAEALLAHLENVGAMLAQALTMADLIRIEVHGPAAQLAKLKEPLAHLKPAWFELHADRGDEQAENARSDAQTNIAQQSSQEFSRKQKHQREQGNTYGHRHQARSQFCAFSFPGFASVKDQVRDDARSDQKGHGERNNDLAISRLGF